MRLAVLIDADNISWTDAKEVFDIAERLGEAITRRAFGNVTIFSGKDGWKEPVRNFAIRHVRRSAMSTARMQPTSPSSSMPWIASILDVMMGSYWCPATVTSPVWRNASGTMARRCMGLEMDAHP